MVEACKPYQFKSAKLGIDVQVVHGGATRQGNNDVTIISPVFDKIFNYTQERLPENYIEARRTLGDLAQALGVSVSAIGKKEPEPTFTQTIQRIANGQDKLVATLFTNQGRTEKWLDRLVEGEIMTPAQRTEADKALKEARSAHSAPGANVPCVKAKDLVVKQVGRN